MFPDSKQEHADPVLQLAKWNGVARDWYRVGAERVRVEKRKTRENRYLLRIKHACAEDCSMRLFEREDLIDNTAGVVSQNLCPKGHTQRYKVDTKEMALEGGEIVVIAEEAIREYGITCR